MTLSFGVSAIACVFAALCYAEFASIIPVSGSAYTYAYATIGELLAWIIGWDLILEYAVCSITVAIGWSGYLVNLLAGIGIIIPVWMCTPPFNLPALFIVAIITTLLVIGIKESAKFNNVIVIVKLAIILFFIVLGLFFIRPENWNPFMQYGWTGVMTGAAIVFFAYIGFGQAFSQYLKDICQDLLLVVMMLFLLRTEKDFLFVFKGLIIVFFISCIYGLYETYMIVFRQRE